MSPPRAGPFREEALITERETSFSTGRACCPVGLRRTTHVRVGARLSPRGSFLATMREFRVVGAAVTRTLSDAKESLLRKPREGPLLRKKVDAYALLAEWKSRDEEWHEAVRVAVACLPAAPAAVDQFSPDQLAKVSWAVPGLLPDISKDACQAFLSRTDSSLCRPDRVGRLTPQGVADAVAGFARGQHVQAALPAVHREHVLRGGGGYKAWVQERGVSFTVAAKWVWACTALRAECAELMGAVADRVRAAHPRDLTPRVLATFMWAFVKAHHAEVRTVLDCVGAAVGAGRSPAAFGKAHAARVLWSVGEYVGRGGTWDGAPRAVPALVNVVLGVGEAQATRGGDDEGEAFFEADDMGLLTATLWACASCRIAGETVELIAQRVRHPHGRGGQGGGAITDERLPLALWSFHRLRRWDMCDVLSRQLLQRGQEGARVTPAAAYPILRMLHQTEYHHPELLDAVLAAFLPVGNGPSGFAGVDGVKRAMGVARAGLQFAPLDPRAVRHALLHLTRLGTCQQLPARDLLDVLRAAAAYPDALPEATARRLAAHAGSVEVLTTARKDEAALLRDAAARLRAGGRAAAGPPGRQRNSFADIT